MLSHPTGNNGDGFNRCDFAITLRQGNDKERDRAINDLGRDHVIIADQPAGFFQKVLDICSRQP